MGIAICIEAEYASLFLLQKIERNIAMSFLSKLLGLEPDPRERLRPLWHRVIEQSRNVYWYQECGVQDSVAGRFDMITAVLSAVLVRLEAGEAMQAHSALLTEFFVEDMDGQLREFGTNDVVVGKRMGKLVSVLGGRLGAYRPALVERDCPALDEAIRRNVTLAPESSVEPLRARLFDLSDRLAALSDEALLKAEAPL